MEVSRVLERFMVIGHISTTDTSKLKVISR